MLQLLKETSFLPLQIPLAAKVIGLSIIFWQLEELERTATSFLHFN
jgi:hypothetical protein